MGRFCARNATLLANHSACGQARPTVGDGSYTLGYAKVAFAHAMSARRSGLMNGLHGALGVLGFVLTTYGAMLGWLWLAQEKLLFVPTALAQRSALATAPDIHETWIEVPGARLSALHLQLPDPKGVVFFLHGNGGNLQSWFVMPEFYRRANFDLFMIDYRGYGKSSGKIESQAQLQADVRAAWASIAGRYQGRKLVVYGRSLGSGLAAALSVELAPSRAPDLTVLVSPYTSMAALMHDHYPWVPSALLRYPLRTDESITRIPNRLLLIHGAQDVLIAPRHSETLQALVPHAQLLRVLGAAHNDLQDSPVYLQGFAGALDAL